MWYSDLISQNQTIIGIFVASGLGYLTYMYLLRINNFFEFVKEFHKNDLGMQLIRETSIKNGEKFYKKDNSKKLTPEHDNLVADAISCLVQLAVMYRLGLINKDLVLFHFEANLRALNTSGREVIEFYENGKIAEISTLTKSVQKRWEWKRKTYKLRKIFGSKF